MADQKISELTAVVTPDNADTLPTTNGGATKKITWTVIKAFLKTYFDTLYRAIDYNNYAADAGSTDAYAITVTPSISAYVIGMEFTFKANTANTGACTLNVNAIAAITIKKNVTEDLATGDILANQIVIVKYDGTNMQMASQLSGTVTSNTTPVVRSYELTTVGASNTQFDITNPSGTTFRYTWDGTGTSPVINTTTFPTSGQIVITGENFNAGNRGKFIITGSGTNYFEVTNASGVAETNITLSNGYLKVITLTNRTWTKPSGLKYAVVEVQGAGASGNDTYAGSSSTFKSITADGGVSTGATATGGDINIRGRWGDASTGADIAGGSGGDSFLGIGGHGVNNSNATNGYQGGGGGGYSPTSSAGDGSPGGCSGAYAKKIYAASALDATELLTLGGGGFAFDGGADNGFAGAGGDGIVIVTEFY